MGASSRARHPNDGGSAEAASRLGLRSLEHCSARMGAHRARAKRRSWAEVLRHNELGGVWLVVDGMILDVKRWLPEHPGGDRIIPAQSLNAEAARHFELYHSSRESFLYLKHFYVGEVRAEDVEKMPLVPGRANSKRQLREYTEILSPRRRRRTTTTRETRERGEGPRAPRGEGEVSGEVSVLTLLSIATQPARRAGEGTRGGLFVQIPPSPPRRIPVSTPYPQRPMRASMASNPQGLPPPEIRARPGAVLHARPPLGGVSAHRRAPRPSRRVMVALLSLDAALNLLGRRPPSTEVRRTAVASADRATRRRAPAPGAPSPPARPPPPSAASTAFSASASPPRPPPPPPPRAPAHRGARTPADTFVDSSALFQDAPVRAPARGAPPGRRFGAADDVEVGLLDDEARLRRAFSWRWRRWRR